MRVRVNTQTHNTGVDVLNCTVTSLPSEWSSESGVQLLPGGGLV